MCMLKPAPLPLIRGNQWSPITYYCTGYSLLMLLDWFHFLFNTFAFEYFRFNIAIGSFALSSFPNFHFVVVIILTFLVYTFLPFQWIYVRLLSAPLYSSSTAPGSTNPGPRCKRKKNVARPVHSPAISIIYPARCLWTLHMECNLFPCTCRCLFSFMFVLIIDYWQSALFYRVLFATTLLYYPHIL